MWIFTVETTHQIGNKQWLIYDFKCSGINSNIRPIPPPEFVRFGWTLSCILSKILGANSDLVPPILMVKDNLINVYMQVWLIP